MRILYVEDNPRDADLTLRMLRRTAPHIQIVCVSAIHDALERLDRLSSEPLDLVLTDMHLRDGDGLSLLKYIRESSLPLAVVLVTGMGDEETAVAALKARADDYIVKRKDYLDRLPITLESALNHYRADAARRAHPLKVLYAENNVHDVDATRRHFAVHADHLHLYVAATGSEALSALRSNERDRRYDVLLINLHLTELNALEVLKELRFMLKDDLPVVLVCGAEDDELAGQALRLGASSYVAKSPGYLYQLPWQIEEAHSRADLLRREAALNASEARNTAILNAIPDLMFLQSRDGTYLDYHAKDPSLFLAHPEKIIGKKMQELLPPQLAAEFLQCFEQALVSDQPIRHEYTLSMPQGTRIFEASIVSCNGDKLLSIVRDITERTLAEKALSESEGRLRLAQNAARVGTWEWDVRTGASAWSEMIWELLGLEPGECAMTVERFVEFIHPEDRDRVWRNVNEVFAEGEEYYDEFRIVRRDGHELWVSSKGRLLRSAAGHPERMLGVNIDITERKLAEEALRESEGRLRLAQQAARVGTWEWDVPMGQAVWSEMMWELLGLEPEDGSIMSLERFIEHIHPEDRERAMRTVNEVITDGEEYYDEFRLVRGDGRVLWISSKGRLIRSASGQPERMIGVNIDITERKLAEEALKHALAEVRELKDRLHEENIYLQEEIRVAGNFVEIIGRSEALQHVLHQAEQVAPVNTTVLILGETGTGKELLAHAIHNLSPRKSHPLVKVNCAALPATLIESELFGHEKGAFTGADARRLGRFQVANRGTLFLDEVGELPLDLQPKLLRVLEEGELEPVGSSHTVKVDARVIAATNRNLAEAVRDGTFRSDLYYRLSTFPITMPPLRERREDISLLVTQLVKQLNVKLGKRIEIIPQETMTALKNYPWPGNIRELSNVIERAVIIAHGTKLRLVDSLKLPSLKAEGAQLDQLEMPFDSRLVQDSEAETLERSEYKLILSTLKKLHWRVEGPGGAAEVLNIHPSTLRSRMKKLGIARPRVQASHG